MPVETTIFPPLRSRGSTSDRRAAIAAAARELIVEKGVEGLRTRDIADRVGINIATLHYHVPTKEALIRLVAESLRADFIAQSQRQPRDAVSPVQQLEHEFDDFEELLDENNHLLAVMSELLERARRDEEIRNGMLPLIGNWKQIVEAILEAGKRSGDFRSDLDPGPAAKMVIGAMIGHSRTPGATPDSFKPLRAELWRALRNPSLPPKDTER